MISTIGNVAIVLLILWESLFQSIEMGKGGFEVWRIYTILFIGIIVYNKIFIDSF